MPVLAFWFGIRAPFLSVRDHRIERHGVPASRAAPGQALVRELGVTPVIARRGTEHGSGLGKLRWVVEQSFALLHGLICRRRLHTSRVRTS